MTKKKSIAGFDNLFQKISNRVERSIVFNDFLNFIIQTASNQPINLTYEYNNEEYDIFRELMEYWEKLTVQEMREHGCYDFFGIYYEEYILATNKASDKGQFFSPQYVCDLMAYIMPNNKKRVYDPACGSGRMVLSYYKLNNQFVFIGEDLDEMSCKMTVCNMYSHRITGVVNNVNTLTREFFKSWKVTENNILLSDEPCSLDFDCVLANPPYGVKWDNTNMDKDVRFKDYGKLAPKSKGDFAFIQHILHYLDTTGQANILLPHGVLFRGASEGKIREYILKHNWLDSIIGLPSNMFEGTSIPTVLLIFKKHKLGSDVFFIDASKEYLKENKHNVLSDDNIDKIITTYLNRENVDKFAYKSTMECIVDNDYNLNIPRYVDTFEDEAPVDLDKVIDALEETYIKQSFVNKEIKKYCDELNIRSPTPELNIYDSTFNKDLISNMRSMSNVDLDVNDMDGESLRRLITIDTIQTEDMGELDKNEKDIEKCDRIVGGKITDYV